MHIARVTPPAPPSLTSLVTMPPMPPAARGVWPAWLQTVLDRRVERRQLLALDERDLRDIGLTRDQVADEIARPIWDVPSNWRR